MRLAGLDQSWLVGLSVRVGVLTITLLFLVKSMRLHATQHYATESFVIPEIVLKLNHFCQGLWRTVHIAQKLSAG
jgi:hypothetical protein